LKKRGTSVDPKQVDTLKKEEAPRKAMTLRPRRKTKIGREIFVKTMDESLSEEVSSSSGDDENVSIVKKKNQVRMTCCQKVQKSLDD
jgi:hypothetical protein